MDNPKSNEQRDAASTAKSETSGSPVSKRPRLSHEQDDDDLMNNKNMKTEDVEDDFGRDKEKEDANEDDEDVNEDDDDEEDEDDEDERWVETGNLRSASRMMNTNSTNTNNGSK